MKQWVLILAGVALLLSLCVTIRQREHFADLDPTTLIKNLKTLLDKYDKPELWAHAKRVHGMTTGELAREYIKG
jgi:hypothetical protein